jgi:hypothetical protein
MELDPAVVWGFAAKLRERAVNRALHAGGMHVIDMKAREAWFGIGRTMPLCMIIGTFSRLQLSFRTLSDLRILVTPQYFTSICRNYPNTSMR